MGFDNGTGQGGGNSSAWWAVTHGSPRNPKQLTPKSAAVASGMAAGLSAPAAAPAASRGTASTLLGAGEVDITSLGPPQAFVEIHDLTDLSTVGDPDHGGCFRVRLRIKMDLLDRVIATEQDAARKRRLTAYRDALPAIAAQLAAFAGPNPTYADQTGWEDTSGDVFLVIDVPAIERKPAAAGAPWPHMPWEIYWQW